MVRCAWVNVCFPQWSSCDRGIGVDFIFFCTFHEDGHDTISPQSNLSSLRECVSRIAMSAANGGMRFL